MLVLRTEALLALFSTLLLTSVCVDASGSRPHRIVVIGSINADTFLPVDRIPIEGENLTLLPGKLPVVDVPGGKGCTQAVAASKLLAPVGGSVSFVGQFGNDVAAQILQQSLVDAHVDVTFCSHHENITSGRGYVFHTTSGQVSAVVSGGSNELGWLEWEHAWEIYNKDRNQILLQGKIDNLLQDCRLVMLQCEVPEYVNRLVARCAAQRGNILVVQDVGGEDRGMNEEHLRHCDYLMPNESELRRLVRSFGGPENDSDIETMAKFLQARGARNILVTQGSKGSTLVADDGTVIHQPAITIEEVLDETGAGDCYRAAFCTALCEGKSLQQCMEWATAAGACSVERLGAVPSTPTRGQVEDRVHTNWVERSVLDIPRGDGLGFRGGAKSFPFLIGSRLNSMKDRPELWDGALDDPREYVRRQSTIKGLTCVDFNFPQHFHTWSNEEAAKSLEMAGLRAGAVCLRYPSKFARGAMNNPDYELRQEAIELTKHAAQMARDLGAKEVVIWSAYDGYDYPFQVDYDEKWDELVGACRECCDAYPDIRFSVEYKPTDENTRFFTIPSTGAALLMVNEVDRQNFGLTLDVGHMLMSGENPGQSIAMVGRAGKLFGVQLNDGFTRLAAEDGLMFGSVHPSMALEIMYQLRRTKFDGHFYFDTFPQRSDPVREAEYNIRRVKAFWYAASSMDTDRLKRVMDEHDAIGALELVDDSLRRI
jgi:ribokinase